MITLIEQHRPAIASLCLRFGVRRLEVFGSAAAGRFDPARSDVDFLVEFDDDPANLFQRYFGLAEALEQLLGRKVDLVSAGTLRNPYFIASVNRSRQIVYASPLAEAA